jgi:sugar lactone lactonase YvrE
MTSSRARRGSLRIPVADALGGRAVLLALVGLFGLGCGGHEPPPPCDPTDPIATFCGFRSPEDIDLAADAGVLVVSQMSLFGGGGSLAAVDPATGASRRLWPTGGAGDFAAQPDLGERGCPPPDPEAFSPHGVHVHRGRQLVVVNHGGRESVELFGLENEGAETRAVWRGCAVLPEGTSGNDVVVAPSGELLVTNYQPSLLSIVGTLKMLVGLETGSVLSWRRDRGWNEIPGSEASGPNGVAVAPDGSWIAFAETGTGKLVRMTRAGDRRDEVAVGGAPDNLTWTADGRLLLAAHESLFSLFTSCDQPSSCAGPWSLFEIDPTTLTARPLLRHDGTRIGTVATALEVGSDVWLGAVLSDRIGRWRRPPEAEPSGASASLPTPSPASP